jgi:hypothetical protein
MRAPLLAGLVAATALAGCATVRDSRLNPLNWFGQSRSAPVAAAATAAAEDPRPLVDQVVAMEVARTPGGAILTATGLPPTQGWWNARLVPLAEGYDGRPLPEDGVMTFDFRLDEPLRPRPSGRQASREVTTGVFLGDSTLAGTRTIVVRGARNQRAARR